MTTDYKVGLALGIGLAVLLVVFFVTRPRRLPSSAPAQSSQEVPTQQISPPVPAPVAGPNEAQIQVPVPAPIEPIAPSVPPPRPQRVHVVREGETLSDIAERYYGTPNRWLRIYKANESVIKDPDRIYPGMRLVIPD
ncbi:MAG: LysM peptidoglycan-binding domain-containing protein [Sedimentisphaerales bacterium]|jgi:nucleoid-associated protein YgaU|nr:LysM peptidoglycan-binding domain-containing protein [Sedimentisphaerales bacterium]